MSALPQNSRHRPALPWSLSRRGRGRGRRPRGWIKRSRPLRRPRQSWPNRPQTSRKPRNNWFVFGLLGYLYIFSHSSQHTNNNLEYILVCLKCTVCVTAVSMLSQASELAEFTAKISLLEEAKRKKDDEATEWQQKVQDSSLHNPRWANIDFLM